MTMDLAHWSLCFYIFNFFMSFLLLFSQVELKLASPKPFQQPCLLAFEKWLWSTLTLRPLPTRSFIHSFVHSRTERQPRTRAGRMRVSPLLLMTHRTGTSTLLHTLLPLRMEVAVPSFPKLQYLIPGPRANSS